MRPNEHADIVLSVHISDEIAATFNQKDVPIDALLILHTSLGKDHFISVCGQWGTLVTIPSCPFSDPDVSTRTDLLRQQYRALSPPGGSRSIGREAAASTQGSGSDGSKGVHAIGYLADEQCNRDGKPLDFPRHRMTLMLLRMACLYKLGMSSSSRLCAR